MAIWKVDRAVRVVDGDTVVLEARRTLDDDGSRRIEETWPLMRVRLVTLDTPERGEVGWAEAKADVVAWLSEHAPGSLEVETYGRDSLGRWLGDVYVAGDRGDTLTQHMLRDQGWLPWVPR